MRIGIAVAVLVIATSGCMAGVGAGVGLFGDSRGAIGVAIRGHATPLGHRLEDTTAFPIVGIDMGAGFAFNDDDWDLQIGVPIGAASFDDTAAGHGWRVAPRFVYQQSTKYGGGKASEAFGAGLDGAYLPHLSSARDVRQHQDGVRIHRLGPALSVSFLRDQEGWFATFFLGAIYDFEAYMSGSR